MTAPATKPDSSQEDIDLFNLIERSLLFFKKYKWAFIIAIIFGLAAGIFFYKAIPKTYSSRMIVHSFMLTNPEEIQIVSNWNQLLGKGEYEVLSARLNCQEQVLRKVKKIKAEEIQQVFSPTNPHGFIVDVLVTDNDILDSLQAAILFGFENTAYVKDKVEMRRTILRELIEKTSAEIKQLDSTKKELENIIAGKEKSSSSLIIDGSNSNKQLIEMNEKLLSFKTDLQFANSVQILQGFSKFRKPSGPKLLPWLVMGLLACLVLAYMYALLRSIGERLKERKMRVS
jgi:capsular polysaccharide biosynthesis protein